MVLRSRQGVRSAMGAAILLLLAASALFVLRLDLFAPDPRDTYTLVVLFPEAPGLEPEAPVLIAGREVGLVSELYILEEPIGDYRLAAEIVLPLEVRTLLRRDSEARLTTVQLLRPPVINLELGSPDQPELAEGDTLLSPETVRVAELAEDARAVRSGFAELGRLSGILRRQADARVPAIRAAVAAMHGADREMDRLVVAYRTVPLHAFVQDPLTRTRLDRIRQHVAAAALIRARRVELSPLVKQIAHSVDEVRLTLDLLAARLDEPHGTLPRVEQDSAIESAIRRLRDQIDALMGGLDPGVR